MISTGSLSLFIFNLSPLFNTHVIRNQSVLFNFRSGVKIRSGVQDVSRKRSDPLSFQHKPNTAAPTTSPSREKPKAQKPRLPPQPKYTYRKLTLDK